MTFPPQPRLNACDAYVRLDVFGVEEFVPDGREICPDCGGFAYFVMQRVSDHAHVYVECRKCHSAGTLNVELEQMMRS